MRYFSEADFIMFDLDNTLYEETDYLFPGYKKIAEYLGKKWQLNVFDIVNYLLSNFKSDHRSNLFNKMLDEFNVPLSELPVILNVLRTYVPENKIQLYPEVHEVFREIKLMLVPLIIITNGNVTQQKNKIRHINWGHFQPMVYFANDFAPKPSPKIYFDCILPKHSEHIKKGNKIYIGDSIIDEIFAQNIGFKFLNISLLRNNKI